MALFLNANRLLSLFWLVYCVLTPISYMLFARLKGLIVITGMPVPPLLVGGLFLVNYLSFRSALFLIDLDEARVQALDELKESNYGLAFAILALYFWCSNGRFLKIGRAG